MVASVSASKSLPATSAVQLPVAASTVAVYVTPLITSVTTVVAASAGIPVKVPVTVTVPVDSAAFNTLSAVTSSMVKVAPAGFGGVRSTVSVPGTDGLPAGSVAIAVMVSPSTKPPGFGTVHSPVVGSVTTSTVVPSGKVTVTVEPGSAVPVIGSVPLTGSISGAAGAVTSTL
ncbi:Siroheme synthase / Precorrin-2 oxidase [Acinetobacter sp. neg1]|nr:Siroheme synthase / Precorrin-2 oxidase [Acinetobacter sp. neg1]